MVTTRLDEPFVVMAKPVGPVCNLECRYCYYLGTAALYAAPHQFRMRDELLERYVREYIAASPGPVVAFVWHGGEPTLAGLDFYRRAVELQRQYLPDGWECWNNLQTNGTLLDDVRYAKDQLETGRVQRLALIHPTDISAAYREIARLARKKFGIPLTARQVERRVRAFQKVGKTLDF